MTRYTPEMRERALRMLAEALPEHANLTSATRHVAGMLGMSPQDPEPVATPDGSQRGRRGRRRERGRSGDQAPQARERRAAQGQRDPQGCERVFHQGARLPLTEMIRFVDEHKDRFGVEPICRVLRPAVQGFLTSRGYRTAKTRTPSARALRDDLLVPEVARLHAENYGVYVILLPPRTKPAASRRATYTRFLTDPCADPVIQASCNVRHLARRRVGATRRGSHLGVG